jgi:hypothetical protein
VSDWVKKADALIQPDLDEVDYSNVEDLLKKHKVCLLVSLHEFLDLLSSSGNVL